MCAPRSWSWSVGSFHLPLRLGNAAFHQSRRLVAQSRLPEPARRGQAYPCVLGCSLRPIGPPLLPALGPVMELNYTDLFDRAARLSPGRTALVDDTGSLSYAELSRLANRLANALL